MLAHKPVDETVIDELSVPHPVADLTAERRVTGCLLAQDPARIDVYQTETPSQSRRLGSLAYSRRSQQDQLHGETAHRWCVDLGRAGTRTSPLLSADELAGAEAGPISLCMTRAVEPRCR
jgi:hypothetical protein